MPIGDFLVVAILVSKLTFYFLYRLSNEQRFDIMRAECWGGSFILMWL